MSSARSYRAEGAARRALGSRLVVVTCVIAILASFAASTSRSNAMTSPSSKAAIVYFYQTVIGDCPNTTDSLVVLCLEAWDFDATVRFDYYGPIDPEPEITLEMLKAEIESAGFAYIASRGSGPRGAELAPPYDLDPPVYLPPSAGGELGCEWYAQVGDAIAGAYEYLQNPQFEFEPGDLWVSGVNEGPWYYWAITLSPLGMQRHINTLASGAIVHAQFDLSAHEARFALTSAKTFVGYGGSLVDVYECEDAATFYSRLCCQDYPLYESRIGSAAAGLGLALYGDPDNWMDAGRSCENLATHYTHLRASPASGDGGVRVEFRAESGAGTRAHRVRGYRALRDYPDRPEVLATIPASAARASGFGALYNADVSAGYTLYDVVEESDGPRDSWSEPVCVTTRAWPEPAAGFDRALFRDFEAPRTTDIDDSVYVLEGNDWLPWHAEAQRAHAAASSASSECAGCADYVVYVNSAYPSWATPVRDSLVALGFDVAVFSGSSSLLSARAPLATTRIANAAWNADCELNAPCAKTYPVDPGPTLVVVGDASPVIVSPMSYANPVQCLGSNCRSYVLVADLDSDSIPDCPVEVIPASDFDEVRLAAIAAADLCRGRFVDAGRRVVSVGGDRDAGAASPWVGEFLDETAALYSAGGATAVAPILESDFPVGDNYSGIQTATRDALNEGAAEAWFFGLRTDELKFPAWCVSSISDPANLTRGQRLIVWAPGCRMGAVQSYDAANFGQPPTSEKLAFNSSAKTVMAGGVFHLDAGYGVKHYTWSRILRDARINAPPGTSVSRIHYDAMRSWYNQFPGDHYALSTVTLGGRATLSDAATAVSLGGAAATRDAGGGELSATNNVGAQPTFRFALDAPTRGTLRVVDASGRIVTTLRDDVMPAGAQQYTWFGKRRDGRDVAAGIYFGVLRTASGRDDVAKVHIVR